MILFREGSISQVSNNNRTIEGGAARGKQKSTLKSKQAGETGQSKGAGGSNAGGSNASGSNAGGSE